MFALTLGTCPAARSSAPGWVSLEMRGPLRGVLDSGTLKALRCTVTTISVEPPRRQPTYACVAGDTLTTGPSAVALLDGDGRPYFVGEAWWATSAERRETWERMVGTLERRWGASVECPGGGRLWLTNEWAMEAQVYRLLEAHHGREYQVGYQVVPRDSSSRSAGCTPIGPA